MTQTRQSPPLSLRQSHFAITNNHSQKLEDSVKIIAATEIVIHAVKGLFHIYIKPQAVDLKLARELYIRTNDFITRVRISSLYFIVFTLTVKYTRHYCLESLYLHTCFLKHHLQTLLSVP